MKLLTPAEAAKALNVNVRTLSRWHAAGWINAVQLPDGQARYRADEVAKILKTGGVTQ